MPAYFISNNRLERFTSIEAIDGLGVSTRIKFDLDESGFLVNSSEEVDKIASSNGRTWNSSESPYDHIRIVNFSDEGQRLEEDDILDIEVPNLDDEDFDEDITEFNVTIHENYDGHHQITFKEMIQKTLIPILRQNILLSVPHGFAQERFTENDFEIHIWSSKIGERNTKPPKKIFDIPVSCRDLAFTDSGLESKKITSDGWVVGELFDNTLYIHHDVCHTGDDDELKLFQKILDEVKQVYNTPERREYLKSLEYKRNLDNFVSLCVSKQLNSMKKMKNAFEDMNYEVDEYRKKLSQSIEKREELRRKMDSLKPTIDLNGGKFQTQYNQLMKLDNVKKIRFPEQGKLLVYTEVLDCVDPRTNKLHEIGAFKITIDMNNRDVRWKNMTRLVKNAYNSEGMQAPHIFKDGHACYGNIEETFAECLAKQDFYSIVILSIKFIQSVNTNDSAGEHIDKWPLKESVKHESETTLAEAV